MEKINKNTKHKKKYSFFKNLVISTLGTLIGMTIIGGIFFSVIKSIFVTDFSNQKKGLIEEKSILKIKFNYPIYDSPNTTFNTISA